MDFSGAVVHGVRPLASEIHIRTPSHDCQEALIQPPVIFTIRPGVDDNDNIKKYAKLLSSHDKLSDHVTELVQGIIEGETCVLAASMTMEQVFKGTKEFKKEVFEKVELELNLFGLLIYSANMKQLVGMVDHEYFSYLRQKSQMEATNQAKVDVVEAKMKGSHERSLRNGRHCRTRQRSTWRRRSCQKKQKIRVKTNMKVYENKKDAELASANSELAKKKVG